MSEHVHAYDDASYEEIARRDTGLRLLLTLLFGVIAGILETLVGLIVLFEVLWTLLTKRAPGIEVRGLANRIITYYYRIGRYLTYNESRPPFPFGEFPPAMEGDAFRAADRESEALGVELPNER